MYFRETNKVRTVKVTMDFSASRILPAKAALMGHNGVGHAVSHSGFKQDDSYGFAMLVNMLQACVPLDLTIKNICTDKESIEIELACGGKGRAFARRGVSNAEKELMKRAVGLCSYAPQNLAMRIFGRVYGQGVNEVCSAFNLACSKAILDSYRQAWTETLYAEETLPHSAGAFLAGCMCLDGQIIAWMLTVNAAQGGLGPLEDSEGNIPIGSKGEIMRKMGMDSIPTIILENRAYVPSVSNELQKASFWVRWNKEYDNTVVGKALIEALEEEHLPFVFSDNAYMRNDLSLEKECCRIGNRLIELGTKYKQSQTSAERVEIAGDLAQLVSEDMGGSIFMSNKLFTLTAGGGLFPGLAAVFSALVPYSEYRETQQIDYKEKEIEQSFAVLVKAVRIILEKHAEALKEIEQKKTAVSAAELLKFS